MVRFEKNPSHRQSDRAPVGVCELSMQAEKQGIADKTENLRAAIQQYVERDIQVRSFRYDDPQQPDRLAIYTGTDRLDIATMRDIAEVYGQMTQFEQGNIPPELTLVPTESNGNGDKFFAWLQFKLQMEMPFNEVEEMLREKMGQVEIVPKDPVGDNMEAILFRNGNVANQQIRMILRKANNIQDALPIEHVRIICEPRGQ